MLEACTMNSARSRRAPPLASVIPASPCGHRVAAIGLCLWLAASQAQGDVAETYTDSGRSELRQGVAVQHFVTPHGCVGKALEFYCDASSARGLADHQIALQVYSADRELLATSTVKLRDLPGRRGWVRLGGLALRPGAYYAQLFTNSAALAPHLKARLFSGSAYRGGHATTGWKGGVPLGPERDFQARLTFEAPPRRTVELGEDAGFLVRGGRANYAIVLALDSTPGEWTAAEELRDHVREISGADLPIVLEPYCEYERIVAVGFNDSLPPSLRRDAFGKLDDQELVIKPSGSVLLLAGGSPRGTLYAVYEFLHRLGVRWYSPDFTKAPKAEDVPVPGETACYSPPVTGRTLNAGNNADPAWMARNRLTTIAHWGAIGRRYGSGGREGPDMHTAWRLIPKSITDKHLDWLCEVKGKRVSRVNLNTWDLCYGKPEVREYFVKRTIQWARQHPDAKTVWIGQNDSPMYCTCKNCRQFYEARGGKPSSVIVQLVNELADALVAHGMADRTAKTLAYAWSAQAPVGMVLRDNATVCVCSSQRVAEWRAVARNIDVYVYGSHNDYWAPHPTIYSKAQELKQAWQDGASQIFLAISGSGGTYGSDLVHLRAWLTARLLWNPASDVQALVEDFCRGYYGPAGEAVLESIRLRHAGFGKGAGKRAGKPSPVVADFVHPPTVRRINKVLGEGYDSLEEGPYKRRLGMAWIPYLWTDFWLGYRGIGRYDPATDTWSVPMEDGEVRNRYGKLAKRFMIENGVNALGERKRIDPRDLALEKMGVPWPARRLTDGRIEALVVPGVGGLVAELRDTQLNFAPLKPCFGGQMLRYPLFSSTEDNVNGAQVSEYEMVTSAPNRVVMRCKREACDIEKSVSLADGALHIALSVVARRNAKLSLSNAVMFDLLDESLGIHPTLYVRKTDGTWRARVLGTETDFWWIQDRIALDGATGELIFASATRPEGIRLTVDPGQLSQLHFWYSRKMNYYPDPTRPDPAQHGMLRLFLSGAKVQGVARGGIDLAYRLELLSDAKAAAEQADR